MASCCGAKTAGREIIHSWGGDNLQKGGLSNRNRHPSSFFSWLCKLFMPIAQKDARLENAGSALNATPGMTEFFGTRETKA
jgi:hypothetical protein